MTKYKIAAHPIQCAIMDLVQDKGIDELSLREISKRIGMEKTSPQKIKHHLTQMVKYGFLDIIGGRYHIGRLMRKEE
jgi:DNA-binding IclR family transcriptional regulator